MSNGTQKSPGAGSEPVDYASDPRLTKGVRAFLKQLNAGAVPLESLPPAEARKGLEQAQAVKVDVSGIDVSEKTLTAEGRPVPLHVVRPAGLRGKLPVFVFLHGGGWALGDFATHKRMVRDLVVRSGYVAVCPDYTLSPEAKYPIAIRQNYAATRWVVEHADELSVDAANLAVVGNSVGGNMTAVTGLMAMQQGGPAIKALIMMWPIVDHTFETESYRQFGKQRFLTTSLMRWMYDQYTTDPKQRREIFASPLGATLEQLAGLPPTLIQTAENDILRDEGEAFGRKLVEAGVEAATVRYLGMIHDFGLLNGLANEPAVHALFDHAAATLRRYLGGGR